MSRTDAILKRLTQLYPRFMDLELTRERRLLAQLGHPERHLPPVIHVAGTNGKGSTVAYLRAFLEAAGKRVHVFTSPHLVRFNERIRIAGKLVASRRLNATLEQVEAINAGQPITQFEITTSAAFKLFAETPADYLLLEVGMGGTYDSTNVIDDPLGVIITPVDLDHQAYLGDTVAKIAANKAGILKSGRPAVIGRQLDEGLAVIERAAAGLRAPLFVQGRDYDGYPQNARLIYQDEAGLLDLPPPALAGHRRRPPGRDPPEPQPTPSLRRQRGDDQRLRCDIGAHHDHVAVTHGMVKRVDGERSIRNREQNTTDDGKPPVRGSCVKRKQR